MAKSAHYNPHEISRAERLAFRLSGDEKIQIKTSQRRRTNRALQVNQQPLRYFQGDQQAKRHTVVQYTKDERGFIQGEF